MISPQASAEKKPPMQVVHMAATELTALDNLQGGPSIDEDTGLREYSALYPAFENESFKDIFRKTAAQLGGKGELDSQYESLYKMGNKPSHYEDTPAEHDPEIHEMEEKGEAPDKHMALLPVNAVKLFLEIEPEANIGEDGLLEFGFWRKVKKGAKSVVRVGATIAGGVLGSALGPIGAPIGAGLANMATGALMGKKIDKKLLMSGLTSGLFTAGAQGLAGAGMIPDSVMNALPKSVSSMLLPAANAGGKGPINLIPPSVSAKGAGAGMGMLGKLFGGSGEGSGSMNMMLPLALSGILSHQGEKRHYKDIERQREEAKKEREEALERSGYYDGASFMEPYKQHEWVENPDWTVGERGEELHGPSRWWREKKPQQAAKGGLIKGAGDGQADKIKTTVPEGSYIIDASSVADFGNGSSEMGGKVLQNMVNEVMRHSPSHHKSGGKTREVPVYLSNDEFTIPYSVVSALGGGNNNIGAKQLRRMVKEIRIHKASKPKGLPPKAKSPFAYMEGR